MSVFSVLALFYPAGNVKDLDSYRELYYYLDALCEAGCCRIVTKSAFWTVPGSFDFANRTGI